MTCTGRSEDTPFLAPETMTRLTTWVIPVWAKSQVTLFGLFCDTARSVWYPKAHYNNVKFRGNLAHHRLTSSLHCTPRTCCSAMYLQDNQRRKKHQTGISDHTAQQSACFTAFKVSSGFLYTCLQEAKASCYMTFSVSPG